jgi:hypothetical protein
VHLPVVPTAVPQGIETPADWRTMGEGARFAPPGYRAAGAPAAHVLEHRDNVGIAGCCVAVVGLLQLLLVAIPFVAVLAIALSLSGNHFARLDPEGIRSAVPARIGLVLGCVGLLTGVGLLLSGTSTIWLS